MAAISILMLLLTAILAGCSADQHAQAPVAPSSNESGAPRLQSLGLQRVLPAPRFQAPTNMIFDNSGRLIVAEQAGRIRIYSEEHLTAEHIFIPEPLDIRDRVSSRGSEEGLLGIALDSNNDRHLYVYYSASNPRRSVVSRFDYFMEISADSEQVILEVRQPYPNHNGGQIAFGPDGYLYIGLGDGGSAGDPQGNGQDTSTLLGSILRIDVSGSTVEQPYVIPRDNPFVGGGGRLEIWAWGLRNPWRFSFDRETGDLWTGDVGQNQWEEIDIIEKRRQLRLERPRGQPLLPLPRQLRPRGQNTARVGVLSRRRALLSHRRLRLPRRRHPLAARNAYVYGDYCSGKVFGLRRQDGRVTEHKQLADTNLRIMSFAEDNAGDLYLLSQGEGVYRLVAGR